MLSMAESALNYIFFVLLCYTRERVFLTPQVCWAIYK